MLKSEFKKSILVTGSSGLVGSALKQALEAKGYSVIAAKRSESNFDWPPVSSLDTVVHLAGENIANHRWTPEFKDRIYRSRVDLTRALSMKLAALSAKPSLMISASAIGIYGDRADEPLLESSNLGSPSGFLSKLCADWESATQPARDAGIRVVNLRIGLVLSERGGALSKMLTPFKMGVGGALGDGKQWMSWIALSDLVSLIIFALENPQVNGPMNAVSPKPISNLEFSKALAKVLGRPAVMRVPKFALKILGGEMADALLLSSARVHPKKALDLGFNFAHSDLERTLKEILKC